MRDDERLYVLAAYGLYLLGLVSGGAFGLIGLVIAFARKGQAAGTIWDSHYRNLILLFWVTLALVLVTVAAAIWGGLFAVFGGWNPIAWLMWPAMLAAMPGLFLAGIVFCVWYLWRLGRGFWRALNDQPY